MTDDMLKNVPYEEEYTSNDLIERLKDVLSKEELMLIVNHLIIGYTFKELAKENNMSINTIMSKYRRALLKANKYLKEDNYNE